MAFKQKLKYATINHNMLNQSFLKLKNNLELNKNFDEIVQQKHNAVRSVIENNLSGVETKLIGSLQKKTRIQPRQQDDFDIDILIILGEFTGWAPVGGAGVSPKDATKSVYYGIGQSERYRSMNPQIDEPTINFEYKKGDVKVELVPAYKDNIGYYSNGTPTVKGRGYWIPQKNGMWGFADYDYEAEHITKMNEVSDGYLIPTIKMLKAIKRNFCPDLGSFHLEILAADSIPSVVSMRKIARLNVNYPALISSFFSLSKDKLNLPQKMYGSCSPTIKLDPLTAIPTGETFEKIGKYCESIEQEQKDESKIDLWKKIFGNLI